MGFAESFKLAIASIKSNKMRSLLTMLGIIIGISAVITITTIGSSIERTLTNTFNQLGINTFSLSLYPKEYIDYLQEDGEIDPAAILGMDTGEEEEEDEDDFSADEVEEDEEDDFEMYSDELYEAAKMTPEMLEELTERYPGQYYIADSMSAGTTELIGKNKETIPAYITGITEGYLPQLKLELLKGRKLTDKDDKNSKYCCMVSDAFCERYFGAADKGLGEDISMNLMGVEVDLTVIGIFEGKSSVMSSMMSSFMSAGQVPEFIYIPFGAASDISGYEQTGRDYVDLSWNTEYDSEVLKEQLQDFFREKYADIDGYGVMISNMADELGMINSVINVITIAISVIAAISLLVGGVGVMNIMLVSVVERTKEIGIEKALGAKRNVIRRQFIIESIVICVIGGIIGIILGFLGGAAIGAIAKALLQNSSAMSGMAGIVDITIRPSIGAIIISVGFSVLVGVFFGTYPANKAAKLDPIEALRHE